MTVEIKNGGAPRDASSLTEGLVQHGLLGLLLLIVAVVVVVNERRVGEPLAVGRGPQQHHDHQQDGGEEQAPEGVVHPQVPPFLRGGGHAGRQKHTATESMAVARGSGHTHRLAVDQLEDLCGPDDEHDGGCGRRRSNVASSLINF